MLKMLVRMDGSGGVWAGRLVVARVKQIPITASAEHVNAFMVCVEHDDCWRGRQCVYPPLCCNSLVNLCITQSAGFAQTDGEQFRNS
jgi:hypothetical protein